MDITEDVKKSILSNSFFKGKVVSGSMEPVVMIGDDIVVEIKSLDLKRFDIIVFVQDQKLICHYLWTTNKFIRPILMQTRSMSGARDFPIKEENYIGKVVSHRLSFFQKMKILFFK